MFHIAGTQYSNAANIIWPRFTSRQSGTLARKLVWGFGHLAIEVCFGVRVSCFVLMEARGSGGALLYDGHVETGFLPEYV